MTEVHERYRYNPGYITEVDVFKDTVLCKTVKPHQVEWQPGPTGKICWLECPYCYGGTAELSSDRLPLDRALAVMDEIADGDVKKVIFAGYATDPLNSPDIAPLVRAAQANDMVIGFNTKALRISPDLRRTFLSPVRELSYMSVSVDAGSDAIYNVVHGVTSRAPLYQRVRANVAELAAIFKGRQPRLEIMATYLLNRLNTDKQEVEQFLADFTSAGANIIRFTFAQMPRGRSDMPTIPTAEECLQFKVLLAPIIARWDSVSCRVMLADADTDHNLFRKARTHPCVAQWVYPTVGYDGWLYPCSQTAAPNFRDMALGNLAERGFWEMYRDYPAENLRGYMHTQHCLMDALECRCDRKEHLVNLQAVEAFR